MITELSDEALAYGQSARQALAAAGGDELAVAVALDPSSWDARVAPVLDGLGAWDLDVRGDVDELEAAAALCRAAGWYALASPLPDRLTGPVDVELLLADGQQAANPDLALGLVLPCWSLLGMLDRALRLTVDHVRQREQFGAPLAALQSVQFQLTDVEVERSGVEELARYALWSIETHRPEAVDDALALRLAALDGAATALRICHQLHGAIGFCDETTLSWVSRASRPLRRHPLGLSATRDALQRRLGRHGLVGLYRGVDG